MVKHTSKAYSIAEALATLFIISIIFVAVAPSIIGKKPKIASFVQALRSHGVYYCNEGNCTFNLPKDVKDIYVIAVGGGGGGAGSSCSEEGTTYGGEQEKDVDGTYEYTPLRTLYISGSSASGGSTQLRHNGKYDCDYYTPADDFNQIPNYGSHSYECNVYKSEGIAHRYGEKKTANMCTHTYWEYIDHPYNDDEWVCNWVDDESSCKTWDETVTPKKCTEYNKKQDCGWETITYHDWYWDNVERTEQCNPGSYHSWKENDTTLPWSYSLEWKGQTTLYSQYCDRNNGKAITYTNGYVGNCSYGSKSFNCCEYASENKYYGADPHIGTDFDWQYIVTGKYPREADLTGRSDVCEISWLHKPEEGRPNRYCNAAVFGGNGGSGRAYYNRVCPIPGEGTCIKYREAHTITSSCTEDQIRTQAESEGCEEIHWTKPKDVTEKLWNTLLKKCSYEQLQYKLMRAGVCGHAYGEYNCFEPHRTPVTKKCIDWDFKGKTIAFTIGYPGKAGKPDGTAGRPIYLNRPTANASGVITLGTDPIDGGDAGRLNAHGSDKGGVSGGGHTGMSREYSALPIYNTEPGKPGWLGFAVKFIDVGLGGRAGTTRAGYFKNVEGPIQITVGAGGLGGANGAEGADGGTTIVKARKGGFNTFYDVPSDDSPTGVAPSGNSQIDTGTNDGTLFVAAGGAGGKHSRNYERCSVSGTTSIFDQDENKYGGGGGYSSEVEGYGRGGNGAGGTVPDCPKSSGENGQNGGVIIFY